MNRRRLLVLVLVASLAGHTTLLRAQASSAGLRRVGVLAPSTRPKEEITLRPFFDQRRELGWMPGVKRIGFPADAKLDQQALAPIAASFGLTLIVAEATNQKRIPVVAAVARVAGAGALFSYGASTPDFLRRSALPVDKIFKGARPADIPVEQPTLFELVVNLKAAKALGITIPQSILLRADRVIE